jgi:SNF2 family DNA or RNA helicase
MQLLPLQSLAVLDSLAAMLARHFGYVADMHFMCLRGSVASKRRQQMILSFNTSPDCKVRWSLVMSMTALW